MTKAGMAQTARMKTKSVHRSERLKSLLACGLLFFLISFLGWCMEKAYFYVSYGVNADRGFLTLPFCTIYGAPLLLVRALLGTPLKEESGYPANILHVALYALLASLIATAAELLVGVTFHQLLGIRLWSYRGYPHEYGGYICLQMSVAWGGLILLAMTFLWTPLERIFRRLPTGLLVFVNLVFTLALGLDFALSLISAI